MIKVRMGMVGGSLDAFIGNVHRMSAAIDNHIELVAGAFSSSPKKSKETGEALGLDPHRVYPSFQEMIDAESQLPEDIRIEFVSIVTPNHLHFQPAKQALEAGIHVLCEKPVSFNLKEALELEQLTNKSELFFGLTHTYAGYPMVKEARHLVHSGKLGKIRKIVAEYPQGWLSAPIEKDGQKQADWRTDPKRSGASCCVGDIGTHAENLAEYISGLKITQVAADVSTFVDGRLLDDDASILVRFEQGVKGLISVSQISCGEENDLKIKVYGDKGGLEWRQGEPNSLVVKYPDRPNEIYRTGVDNAYLSEHALANTRLPSGHPEGYLEAMANLYRNFAKAIVKGKQEMPYDFPSIEDGVRGMRFIEAVIASGEQNAAWQKL